ncbi:MAG: NUDIX domain-containing protein [Caldilineaceae bacterium]
MEVIEHTTNNFGGIILNPAALPATVDEFQTRLRDSMQQWTEQEFKLVWLETPIQRSELIPIAVGMGFIFHHSTDHYLMLVRRLQANAFIPPYSTHYIGIGGVVLNEKQELLVVVEKYHKVSRPNFYKLPGGALQAGEHLVDAAIREVFEETGVQTKFEGLVCFRHWHGYRYGKSDIYFVARLSPLSEEITQDHDEIEECKWMPVDEYLNHPTVHNFNKQIVRAALHSRGLRPSSIEGYDDPKTREFFMPVELSETHGNK